MVWSFSGLFCVGYSTPWNFGSYCLMGLPLMVCFKHFFLGGNASGCMAFLSLLQSFIYGVVIFQELLSDFVEFFMKER